MQAVIYEPLEEFEKKLRALHEEKTNRFFDDLATRSGVDIEKNRETVRQYNAYRENLVKLKRKLNWRRFFRVLMDRIYP